jgi:hypothetical protein
MRQTTMQTTAVVDNSIIVSASAAVDVVIPSAMRQARSCSRHVDCPRATQRAVHSVVVHDLNPARAWPPMNLPFPLPPPSQQC